MTPREGFHSVTPRIVVRDVAAQVDFLREVFGGTGEIHAGRPAEILVGDSIVMVSPASDRDRFPAFLYVYVDDADEVYRRAMDAGAETSSHPSTCRTATGGPWCATRSATSSRSRTSGRRSEGGRPRQRSSRKNARMSSTMSSGSSDGAKWPPRGITVQRVRFACRSMNRRGTRSSSRGNTATAVGTSTGGWRSCTSGQRCANDSA